MQLCRMACAEICAVLEESEAAPAVLPGRARPTKDQSASGRQCSEAAAWEERSCPAKTGSSLCRECEASPLRPQRHGVQTRAGLLGSVLISVVPWPTLECAGDARHIFGRSGSSGRPAPMQSTAQCLPSRSRRRLRVIAEKFGSSSLQAATAKAINSSLHWTQIPRVRLPQMLLRYLVFLICYRDETPGDY